MNTNKWASKTIKELEEKLEAGEQMLEETDDFEVKKHMEQLNEIIRQEIQSRKNVQ